MSAAGGSQPPGRTPGEGGRRAAQQAEGGAGGVASRASKAGARRGSEAARRSSSSDLSAVGPAGAGVARAAAAPAVGSGITEDAARAKIARAGLRQMRREYPQGGDVDTPLGPATTRKVHEKNTRGQPVDYVATADAAYPGSQGEPKKYRDIGSRITPAAAAAAVSAPDADGSRESPDARRAGATASALAVVSETQRNGGGKHARAALRTVGIGRLTAEETYTGDSPAFPQSKPGGMAYHRKIMAGEAPMTAAQREVVDNFSDSSDDEYVNGLSDQQAVRIYREQTETKRGRKGMGVESGEPPPFGAVGSGGGSNGGSAAAGAAASSARLAPPSSSRKRERAQRRAMRTERAQRRAMRNVTKSQRAVPEAASAASSSRKRTRSSVGAGRTSTLPGASAGGGGGPITRSKTQRVLSTRPGSGGSGGAESAPESP